MKLANFGRYLSLLPFLVLIILFLLVPFGWIFVNAFKADGSFFSLANLTKVFTSKFYLQALTTSLKLSFSCSLVAIIIGFQGAYSLYAIRNTKFGKAIVSFNSLLSNFTAVPLAFAMMIVFGGSGVVNIFVERFFGVKELVNIYSYNGILISYIYFQIPLAILLLFPAIESLKKEWQESSALLGASFKTYFLQIALPVLTPALLGTYIILLANALGAYATAYALTTGNFNILPIRISALVAGNVSLEPSLAAALALILVSIMFVITFIHQYLLHKYKF